MKFTTLLSNASILIFLLFSSSSFAQSQLSDGLPGRFDPNKRNTPRPAGTQPIYRTIDGTNNNIAKTKVEWGATNIALAREIPAEYGSADTKNAMGVQPVLLPDRFPMLYVMNLLQPLVPEI